MNALFIGYGRMGSAIGEAWLCAALVDGIHALDPYLTASDSAMVCRHLTDLPDTVFDLIVVAVKPAYACEVLAALPDEACTGAIVVSVAAGVTIDSLDQALRSRAPVVRAMPNTPVLLRAGCTGLYARSTVDAARRSLITRLFESVGTACWVEREGLLDVVTALSGSGPAYYHLFSEALADAGTTLGLPPRLAANLAAQTALGAATLQTQPDADFAALRSAVTSPNGTTAAAVEVFERDQALRALVNAAVVAAFTRAQALSGGSA